jgi:hypothetical protein
MASKYNWIGRLGVLLAVVGAVNWGLIGLFEWNLFAAILGDTAAVVATTAERVVYVLVGIGGVIAIPMLYGTLSRAAASSNVRSLRSENSQAQRKAA